MSALPLVDGLFSFMKKIKLGESGKYALVDDADYEWLNQWTWFWSAGYAVRKTPRPEQKQFIMHRVIMNAPKSTQIVVDHINCNGLDNRRSNLRFANRSQNRANGVSPRIKKTSLFKGVSLNKIKTLSRYKKWYTYYYWKAEITCNGKNYFLGRFKSETEAAKAYDKKAKELFGEFALCNF